MHSESRPSWDETVDFIAIGSGAAGLSGALTAAARNSRCLVLEATDQVGGTTAYSGSLLWVPFNPQARRAGFADDRDTAERYVKRCLGERAVTPLWTTFFDYVNEAIDFVATQTGARFHLTAYPDAKAEWEEGRSCRHLNIDPFAAHRAGSWRRLIRKAPTPWVLTVKEVIESGVFIRPLPGLLPLLPRIAWRLLLRRQAMGTGLVAALLAGCRRHGVALWTNARVVNLVRYEGRVSGVEVNYRGHYKYIRARQGVLMANGGFDWDADLCRNYLPALHDCHLTPPVNQGDNIRLAQAVGAALAHLGEAWNLPAAKIPGTEGDKAAYWQLVGDRTWPHCLMVNRHGKRFVNESAQNTAESFYETDAEGQLQHLPCWIIYDSRFRARYPIAMKLRKQHKTPAWLVEAPTLQALAEKIGVPAENLCATLQRFNQLCRRGVDEDFGRGEGLYERYFGDPKAPHPCLGSVEKAPFYALRVLTSSVGTKGGAQTNRHGQVVDGQGRVIPGLYAAGNAAANFNGPHTVAAGCTLTPAITLAYVAARHAARCFTSAAE